MYIIQILGTAEKLDAFIKSVQSAGIVEVVRSGVSGIARGEKGAVPEMEPAISVGGVPP